MNRAAVDEIAQSSIGVIGNAKDAEEAALGSQSVSEGPDIEPTGNQHRR
jgi:hypothetical protein